jgi:glycerol transport system ATP-binding protein
MTGEAGKLPDGVYTMAIRPHHVTPVAETSNDVALTGKVLVTELSGSESSAHFEMAEEGWVSLAHGVHPYRVGEEHTFFMDASKAFYFGPDGRLVS